MPKVTYKAINADDPKDTKVGGYSFEGGKSVDVKDEALAKKLEKNPWFTVSGQKKEAAPEPANPGVDGEPVSMANNPVYPPGVGSKTAPPSVMTSEGETLPPDEGTRKQEELDADERRGPGRPKKS